MRVSKSRRNRQSFSYKRRLLQAVVLFGFITLFFASAYGITSVAQYQLTFMKEQYTLSAANPPIAEITASPTIIGASSQPESSLAPTPQASSAAPSSDEEEEPFVPTDDPNKKVAYLTFDDGPGKLTDQLLDILQNKDVPATFFMIGTQMSKHPELVQRVEREGHYPGLHSMSHDYKLLYKSGSSANFLQEFEKQQALLKQLTGFHTILIRAPYGSSPNIDESFRSDIVAKGFRMWDWTTDSLDWDLPNKPDEIVKQIKASVKKRTEVILMHERQQTLDALPAIIDYLQSEGYELRAFDPARPVSVNFGGDDRL